MRAEVLVQTDVAVAALHPHPQRHPEGTRSHCDGRREPSARCRADGGSDCPGFVFKTLYFLTYL